ncbi:hypothetical protein LTR66_009443 [Elasticomyces elasticus]|nr:hypothetical protein LTR66_009443 [Elasticomyces elasticus]KAK4987297.1 hypothetical protein LTR50_004723 [Elasticomyces elasticus]
MSLQHTVFHPSYADEKKAAQDGSGKDVDVETVPVYDDDRLVDFEEKTELKRGLHQRHDCSGWYNRHGRNPFTCDSVARANNPIRISFLGLAKRLLEVARSAHCRFIPLLTTRRKLIAISLGYAFVGSLVTGPVLSIGELSALVPLSGGIIGHADYFVDPAISSANGWNQVYSYMVSLPAEIVAAALSIEFWKTINSATWITIFGALLGVSIRTPDSWRTWHVVKSTYHCRADVDPGYAYNELTEVATTCCMPVGLATDTD